MNLLSNYIYLYHLDKFCVLPAFPESITDSMQSTFASTDALARSAPVQTYSKSGPRTVNFTLDLHRDMMDELNTNVSNLKENVVDFRNKDYVDVLLNYLQACALPKYNVYKTGAKAVDPPQVAVRIGDEFFIRGVITSGITVTYKKPILDNGKYASAQVSLTITEVDPYDAPTVAMVGGFRGISSTFKSGIFKDKSDSISYNPQEYTWATNLNETTTIDASPRWPSNKPGNVMAQINVDAIRQRNAEVAANSTYQMNKVRDIVATKIGDTEYISSGIKNTTQKKPTGTNSTYINTMKTEYMNKDLHDLMLSGKSVTDVMNTNKTNNKYGSDTSVMNLDLQDAMLMGMSASQFNTGRK